MHPDIQKIREIARKSRRWAKRYAKAPKNIGVAYSDLTGMCGIASAYLHRQLVANGISAKIKVWNDQSEAHCYVMVDDLVVDVTASQFGFKPVVVMPLKDAKNFAHWRGRITLDSADDLHHYQVKSGWPPEQTWKGSLP